MKAKAYKPSGAYPSNGPVSEVPPARGPMKTSWENIAGSAQHTIDINAEEVVIATSYGNPHAGGGGTSCSHEEFLSGTHNGLVIDLFGEGTLREVISYVKRAAGHDEFIKKRADLNERKQFILSIPKNSRIKTMIGSKEIINGFRNYGNLGGYQTECREGNHRFFVGKDENYIEDSVTGKRCHFDVPGYCTSVVSMGERFYFVCWDNFWVVDTAGKILYDTFGLKDTNGEKLIGEALRVGGTLRYKRTIIVRVWWIGTSMPDSYLIFNAKSLRFTGRYDD